MAGHGSHDADRASDRACERASDRGETLLELLISVMIMGIALVVLLGGLATAIRISDIHRDQARVNAHLRDFAEAVQTAVAASPTGYVNCAGPATYRAAFGFSDPKYGAEVVQVRYWDGTAAFGTACAPATDTGVQRVTLRVFSNDGDASESVDLVIRRPCRPLDAPCA